MISIALKFGPSEFFWLGIFALTIIGGLAGDSMLKDLLGCHRFADQRHRNQPW